MEEKNNKIKIILTVILGIVGIAMIAVGFSILNSPKNIMVATLTSFKENLKNSNKELTKMMEFMSNTDKIEVSGDMKVSFSKEDTVKFDYKYIENKSLKKSYLEGFATRDDEPTEKIKLYFANNKIYETMEGVIDKYYYEDFDFVSIFENVNNENYEVFYDLFIKALDKELTNSDFKKTKEKINFAGKEISTTKESLGIDNLLVARVIERYATELKNNKEAQDLLVKLFDVEKQEIYDLLNDAAAELREYEVEEALYLNIYRKGFNEVVLIELTDNENKISFDYYHYDNITKIQVTSGGEKIELEAKTEKDVTNLTLTVFGEKILTGTITKGKDVTTYSLVFTIDEEQAKIDITTGTKEIKENSEYSTTFEIKVSIPSEDVDVLLAVNANFKIADEISLAEVENAVDLWDMTEEDRTALSNSKFANFIEEMEEMIEDSADTIVGDIFGSDDDYDYDYDYDYDSDITFDTFEDNANDIWVEFEA